ncbi:MAG TPA: bifunctional phosphopantothenoylcysteine decarboxylase/phosphopantothenate--cysteine ligase CoaBC [Candidatus Udaeobacter sp.]|nr:bifunctional phosphopantothenoylcysteine decarboxylase/phosphopantothenate--cysteine ligase CoaBC [Candidatus Udaeobacter sp.]
MPLDDTPVPEELRGLRIALLVSGGVAAYKIVDLASALTQAGCEVKVAMTHSAMRFVGPPTFEGVTGHAAITSLWSADGSPEPHVALGDWAQVILIAPATANVIGRIAQGRSDDIVTATVLAARCPIVVAPAMNDAMWAKQAVQENIAALRKRGFALAPPESGHLASGHEGAGRLARPASILEAMVHVVRGRYDYAGRHVVVTAGGTREAIDPVRFISNYSSGKMGFALAAAAADRGAHVTLITTASHQAYHGVEVLQVETADEMLRALKSKMNDANVLFMAAAVADFRPARTATGKIRREDTRTLTLQLEPVPDLLLELAGDEHGAHVFRVGFAAEDSAHETKAAEKVRRKGLHAIVANDISRRDIGFGSDFNAGSLIFADGSRHELKRTTKREMADRILSLVLPRLKHPAD